MEDLKRKAAKKKRAARISAVVMIVLIGLWDLILFGINAYDPVPLPILCWMGIPANVVIVGIILALRERIKEIEGGEEDEAIHY